MMANLSATPYAELDPNVILNAIDSVGLTCSGSLLVLNSYENRVYQVGIEDNPALIAKFYRPQRWSDNTILEEHQFAQELAQHEIPVIPPLMINKHSLHSFQTYRFALFPCQGGRPLELDNLSHLEWMGRFLGRLHAVGATRSFLHRPTLDIQTYGYDAYHFLIEHNFIPDYLRANFCHTVDTVLPLIEQIFQQVGRIEIIRLHGDMHAGNVLWNDKGPHIVDLDDCLTGPAIQDLWMLLSGDKDQVQWQLDYILRGYNEFYDFNYRELHLVEPLRTLRQLHYAAWLARRWDDPAFPASFTWFNTPRYWEEQWRNLTEQRELLEQVSNALDIYPI